MPILPSHRTVLFMFDLGITPLPTPSLRGPLLARVLAGASAPTTGPNRLPPLTRGRALRLFAPVSRRRSASLLDDTGAATAEYAIATMAAVAFAGLLVVIMKSDEVRSILTDLVRRALTVA